VTSSEDDLCQLCLQPILTGEEILENDEGVRVHRRCYEREE